MAHPPGKHRGRYDDPYTFDDPYINSPPSAHNIPAYTYVGTEEALSPRPGSPSRRTLSPDHRRARRNARTTSPPRHSRHHRVPTPPLQTSRHPSSPPSKDKPRDRAHDKNIMSRGREFYHGFVEKNPKLQHYGKQGLGFMGEAAAAYAAAHAGEGAEEHIRHSPRGRSADHGDRHDRPRRRHRQYTPSPSRSPSPPPRRRRSSRHDDYDRDHHRRRQHSPSPPPRSRDDDRSRGRRHHRYSSSPSRSPSRRRRRHSRSRHRNNTAPPAQPTVDRWQMAARAALEAGGLTAYRLRKEPGSWTGGKAAKIATAALGAAALDAFMDQDPRSAKRGIKGMAENAVTSLIASQIMGRAYKKNRSR
ncbi:hypothetical protein F5B18DRAFT_590326 [Nemania serpens]|nr:hypothetical protein F5B18DRAFT_590326 [Nemania serpens]